MTEERRRQDEAMQLASKALTKIEMHENACEHKYVELINRFEGVEKSINRLFDRFWLSAIGVICILLTVSAYLYIESATINMEFMKQMVSQKHNTP